MVIGTIGGTKITMLNLYAQTKTDFFQKIASLSANKAEGTILIGGAFYCVLGSQQK